MKTIKNLSVKAPELHILAKINEIVDWINEQERNKEEARKALQQGLPNEDWGD